MRPGQNKRMRGRNNNNGGGHRRGPNPLTRSYESNGPDVKIRGTAQHIGEKYLQLARDAQTSGDPVAAENYLQHAEHYFRIIAAAQQAQQQAQFGYQRAPGEVDADEGDSDDDVVMPDRFALPSERFPQANGTGQQPPYPAQNGGYERQDRNQQQPTGEPYRAERQPSPDQRDNREQRQDRDQRQDYRSGNEFRQNGERQPWDRQGGERQGGERQNWDRQGGERGNYDRPYRNDRNQQRGPRPQREGQEQRGERDYQPREYRDARDAGVTEARPRPEAQPTETESGGELPAFITAPVRAAGAPAQTERAPDMEATASTMLGEAPSAPAEPSAPEPELFPVKTRRRRRPRAALDIEPVSEQAPEAADPSSE